MGPKPKPKKGKKRGDEQALSKEEKDIASHVRFNCPTKTTMFAGNEVHYFKASDALECLAKSKWGAGKKAAKFPKEADAVSYMHELMTKGLFWRARKLVPKKKPKEDEAKKDKDPDAESSKAEPDATPKKPGRKDKRRKDKDEEPEDATEDPDKEDKEKEEDKKEGKKKKRKVKLEFHAEQMFFDSGLVSDVYVWHYDPSSWTQYLIGTLIVLGSIVVCLFPLWPPWLRLGVYYLSVLAMVGVGVLIGLIVLRTIVFGLVWLCSMGKHHLWILPNLTEDCGFFESFKPAYDYKFYPSQADKDEADQAKAAVKRAKEEAEEEEEEGEEVDVAPTEDDEENDDQPTASDEDDQLSQPELCPGTGEEDGSGSEGNSSKPRRRRVRRENEGFEIVDKDE